MNDQLMQRPTNLPATVQEAAGRIKLMVQNGKSLNDQEALALAQYSLASGLDPFCNECYYLPGIGPGPGIAGWRRKADEQLEYEARRAAEPIARFWVDYVEASPEETGNLATGDIAVKAILHDTLTKNAHEKRTLGAYIQLMAAKAPDAWEMAQKISGPEPVWTAIGVVRMAENFGGDKMPRYERACKRAEKAAIRKRFPRVHLPEPEGFDSADVVDVQFTDAKPKRSEAEIMAELGFGEAQKQEQVQAVEYPDSRAWDKWIELTEQAAALGVGVPPIIDGQEITLQELRDAYEALRAEVKARKAAM